MKRLIYILFILLPFALKGQYTVKYNGKTVTNGGGFTVHAQADNIPTSPEDEDDPDPIPDWEDYIDSIFHQDFELIGTDAQYSNADIEGDWDFVYSWDTYINGGGLHRSGDYNLSIIEVDPVSDGTGGTTLAMKATMDDGMFNLTGAEVPEHDPTQNHGDGFRFNPSINGGQECYFSYNIMFHPTFDGVGEVKLPTIRGGIWNTYTDTNAPSGTDFMTGFSAAITIDGDYGGGTEGAIRWYSRWYGKNLPNNPSSGGNGYWEYSAGNDYIFDFADSTWYNITIRVSLNDAGVANGLLEGFINGVCMGQWLDLQLMGTDALYDDFVIDRLGLQMFFGGSDDNFAASQDEWIIIDDLWVFEYLPEVTHPAPQVAWDLYDTVPYLPGFDVENGRRWDYNE